MAVDFFTRVSGAPISWGVSEQPGWGVRLPVERVLAELVDSGLAATELGDAGFFPDGDQATLDLLGEYGVQMVGGFVPLVLHDADRRAEAMERAEQAAKRLNALGAEYFVTATIYEYDWRTPVPIEAAQFAVLSDSLKALDDLCDRYNLTQVLHPHVNTVVETARDVELALEHTDVRWCMDSGHLAIGGVDPVAFTKENADRIAHVHLKDVKLDVAPRVLSREFDMREGVANGLFQPFGKGDVAIDACVFALEDAGYDGWYVMEQDTFVPSDPAPGEGPVQDLRISLDYLRDQVAPKL